MRFNHVALSSSSEENSDRFFCDLLGLKKIASKVVPPDLAFKLFDVEAEYHLIDYGNDYIKFEVFLVGEAMPDLKTVDHVCLELEDRAAFLAKAHDMGLETRQAPKGDTYVLFVKDFDGNQFEIKEKI